MTRCWIAWALIACAATAAAASPPAPAPRLPAAATPGARAGAVTAPPRARGRARPPARAPRPHAALPPAPRRAAASRPARAGAPPARAERTRAASRPARPPRSAAPAPRARRPAARDEIPREPILGGADRVDGQAPRGLVAFTFDDGPNADTTPAVLEALDHYGVPGAFFVVTSRITGPRTARHRAALARVIEAGHVVAPHSVTHRNLRRASARTLRREIDGSLRAVIAAAGRPIGLFRPPFGALDRRGRAILAKRGLTDVRWSIDPADWQARDAAELRRRTVETVLRNEGGIVLLHDAKALTAQALPLILDDLEAANCQRLAEQRSPILPAPLHYFLHDRGEPRPVPAEIRRRTEAYRAALPARCAARAAAAPRADPAPAPPTPSATLAEAPAGAPAPAGARPAR